MKQHGRKSAAALAVVGANGIETVRRPEPPAELSDEMREVWRRIVSGKPADWFDAGAQIVLAQLCRHVVAARRAAQLIAQEEASADFDPAYWDRLLKAQERQSNAVAALATKLRLTPQSRYTPGRAGTEAGKGGVGPKPWEQ